MAVRDYSASAGLNTSIGGKDISEGSPAANVNDALRQLMADVKADDRLCIFVESYRASGYTDRQTIADAMTAFQARTGGFLVFDTGRTYALGNQATAATLFTLTGMRNAVIDFNGAILTINTTASVIPVILEISDFQNVLVRNVTFKDLGFANTITWRGAYFVRLSGATGEGRGFAFDNVRAEDCLGPFVVRDATHRVSGIFIPANCYFKNVYYGTSFQDNGDDAHLYYTCEGIIRAYFPYGVSNHEGHLKIVGTGTPLGEGCVVIMRATRDTKGIRLRLTFSGSLDTWQASGPAAGYLVSINHQNDDGATSLIDDIELDINVESGTTDTYSCRRVLLRSYTTNAVSENVGAIAHKWGKITLGGNLGAIAGQRVFCNCIPDVKPVIVFRNGIKGRSAVMTVPEGFVVQPMNDHYIVEKFGDLTSGTIKIPAQALENLVGAVIVKIYAEKTSNANTSGASTKMHYFEDIVGVFALAGPASDIITGSPTAIGVKAFNASNLTRAYAGDASGNLVITLGGSDYAVSTAYARVHVEALSRPLVI